ncbi:MAG: class II glutamine amidotransferase [Planctomycetes bacterium]|nr:class II glutamine amidotransferase [Planctomycetota bacterium]
MCRFLVYKGREIFMSDLITRPEHSLIHQSFKAEERKEPLNGDGFGVGWYVPEVDPSPCVFTSVRPAWSERNLQRLAEKTRSGCLFAHVRAATPGTHVMELNCHPFVYDRYLFMHNGSIAEFKSVKRAIRERLSDERYDWVAGTTDSELIFGLFLDRLLGASDGNGGDAMRAALIATIRELEAVLAEHAVTRPSHFNFAVTDGVHVVATRYVTHSERQPPSLYVCRGEEFGVGDGSYRMQAADGEDQAVIIASEPITEDRTGWERIPGHHLISIDPDCRVRLDPLAVE